MCKGGVKLKYSGRRGAHKIHLTTFTVILNHSFDGICLLVIEYLFSKFIEDPMKSECFQLLEFPYYLYI
jgi:hypothetical protein